MRPGEPATIRFTVESVGPIGPAAIVVRALDVLAARVGRYSGVVEEFPEGFMSEPCSTGMNSIDIKIDGETHTFGALVQYYLVQNFVELQGVPSTKGRPLAFAGYRVPHPLETSIIVRLGVGGVGGQLDSPEQRLQRSH